MNNINSKSYFILLTLLIVIMISCTGNYNEELLHGHWQTNKWVVQNTGKRISDKMDFHFKENGEYAIDYGTLKEEGKFWIRADYLHTVEHGQTEKSVKVLKLNKDSFRFQMNRAGSLENVLLLKQ